MLRALQGKFFSSFSWAVLIALIPLAGCGKSPPPQFHSNLVFMAKNNVSEQHQQQIANILEAMFGTPDDPFVAPESGLDLQKIKMASGPVKSTRSGEKLGLFREHCVHCHGITGDALGPTSVFLKPYPRDYRQGWYKFKSTPSNTPPTHEDLSAHAQGRHYGHGDAVVQTAAAVGN